METTGSETIRVGKCIVVGEDGWFKDKVYGLQRLKRKVSPIYALVPKIVFK